MSRKNMRNPMERAEFENPAGDVMQELSENELDKVTGGIDYVSNKNSCEDICTITGECQGTKVRNRDKIKNKEFLCCGDRNFRVLSRRNLFSRIVEA